MKKLFSFAHTKQTLVLLASLLSVSAQANLIMSGTRFIYPQGEQAITVEITNPDSYPALAQSWLEYPDAENQDKKIPFIITPALVRLDSDDKLNLRIRHTGEALANDRESLFYLNILDVPAKPKSAEGSNYLQFTFANRLKFFYRPKNLPYAVDASYDKVTWHLSDDGMIINNPTPYYMNYVGFELYHDDRAVSSEFIEADMVAPFSTATAKITLDKENLDINAVKWYVINDYGGTRTGISKLSK